MSLAAANYVSGLTGRFELGTTHYRFGKWKMSFKTNLPKTTNFEGGGFQEVVPGITAATLSASGPYDQGNMALTCGNSYTANLVVNSSLTITTVMYIETLELDDDAENNATISITAQSSGSFTAAVT